MFPNLDAEQARNGHTDVFLAKELGITRHTLAKRKRVGDFKLSEINTMLSMYCVAFDYLFSSQVRAQTPLIGFDASEAS